MKKLLFALLLLPVLSHALEVDEKLTLRIIRTSETKKTIMINRGTEDGLVEGDHARFIVTAGIVARAVCVRVSPTRSVWSVYRLVNADFIQQDAVMSLKITPPIKITKDETQALIQDDTSDRASSNKELGIPLADGANDLNPAEDAANAAEMASLDGTAVSLAERNLEIFGIINISSLSSTSSIDGGDVYKGSQSSHHIGLGGELYPQREREWYSRFSLTSSLNLIRLNNQAYNGASSTNDLMELSVGANWHPSAMPSAAFEFIPFLHASANFGSSKSTMKPGTEAPGGVELSSDGVTSGFSVGFGYKYFTGKGFGARVLADYLMRNEKYKSDQLSSIHTKTVSGPRLMMGLSYRF